MDNKQQKGLRLSKEILDDIERRTKDDDFIFSDWVETKYVEDFLTENGLKNKIDLLQKQTKSEQNRLTALKRNRQIWLTALKRNLTKEQKIMLKDSKRLLKESPELIEGRIKLYNNTFKENISKYQFQEMMEVV